MKHNWEKDENGNVNEWAWESGFHNGVFCVDCGKSVCVHCDPDYMELDDCTGPEPGIDAATALSTLQAENEKLRETVDKYATAARVIALHLKPFCDESLPYDEMIADAARKASDELEQVKNERDSARATLHWIEMRGQKED